MSAPMRGVNLRGRIQYGLDAVNKEGTNSDYEHVTISASHES